MCANHHYSILHFTVSHKIQEICKSNVYSTSGGKYVKTKWPSHTLKTSKAAKSARELFN